jgi:hypothetical protein
VTDASARNAMYRSINNYIMQNVVGVPYVHTKPALGFARNVAGFKPSPTLNDEFALVRVT